MSRARASFKGEDCAFAPWKCASDCCAKKRRLSESGRRNGAFIGFGLHFTNRTEPRFPTSSVGTLVCNNDGCSLRTRLEVSPTGRNFHLLGAACESVFQTE